MSNPLGLNAKDRKVYLLNIDESDKETQEFIELYSAICYKNKTAEFNMEFFPRVLDFFHKKAGYVLKNSEEEYEFEGNVVVTFSMGIWLNFESKTSGVYVKLISLIKA